MVLLVKKIIRERISESLYWKEQTFRLNCPAATLSDRAVELTYIGGQYGDQKPTPFLCLVFKLLQLMPEREIVLQYLHDTDFKYLRSAVDIFKILEKLKLRGQAGFRLTYMDEFIDDLLTNDRVCDIALPRVPTRAQLEDLDKLEPRESALESEIESGDESVASGGEDD
ncbi:PRP38-domain-containing protein [Terfezia boudieri ATCC MYA-4762]|uniref:Pre-mRNA-splicing factor 38 n=1 Tax=Terfezia boudieri ATCC MYA-4762 TaxID=1051890 RepID=A0A3N4M238_9PEZI|nr:PRP38-domain-containing protein [Terfezia boudieri ATCC MYA-4762]